MGIWDLAKPVIAQVHGYALAGGCETTTTPAAATGGTPGPDAPVNLNTADADQLDALARELPRARAARELPLLRRARPQLACGIVLVLSVIAKQASAIAASASPY